MTARLFSIFVILVTIKMLPAQALSARPPVDTIRQPAASKPTYYDVLGISENASVDEVKAGYRNLALTYHPDRPGANEAKFKEVQEAYDVLSSEVKRPIYDRLINNLVTLPTPEEQIAMRDMADYINRPRQGLVKSSVYGLGNFAIEMALFNLAVGTVEIAKCFYENDASSCKRYFDSLHEPMGYVSFATFVGTSRFFSWSLLKVTGPKNWAYFLAGNFGMASGLLVSDALSDIYNNPETAKAIAATNPEDRRRHLLKLYSVTIGDPIWYEYKVPVLASIFASAFAADYTTRYARAYYLKALNALKAEQNVDIGTDRRLPPPDEPVVGEKSVKPTSGSVNEESATCGGMLSTVLAAPAVVKPPLYKYAWQKIRAMGPRFAHLTVFLAYSKLTLPLAEWSWNKIRGGSELPYLGGALAKVDALAQPIGNLEKPDTKELRIASVRVQYIFDLYRARLFKDVSAERSRYAPEIDNLDQAISKIELTYAWLANGAAKDGRFCQPLIAQYYKGAKTCNDPVVQKDLDRYSESFFCGPSVIEAYDRAQALRGIPNPLHWTTSIKPFRIVPDDKKLCGASLDVRLRNLRVNPYFDDVKTKMSQLRDELKPEISEIVKNYETEIETKLTLALNDPNAPSHSFTFTSLGVPHTVHWNDNALSLLDAESEIWKVFATDYKNDYADRNKADERYVDDSVGGRFEQLYSQTQVKLRAAQGLLAFIQKPASERTKTSSFIAPQIDDQDWLEVIRNYKAYNLRR